VASDKLSVESLTDALKTAGLDVVPTIAEEPQAAVDGVVPSDSAGWMAAPSVLLLVGGALASLASSQ